MSQNLGDLLRELKKYPKINYRTTDTEINNAMLQSSDLKLKIGECIQFELSMGRPHPLGSNRHRRTIAIIEGVKGSFIQHFIVSREDVELLRDLEGKKISEWTQDQRFKFASWGAELIDIEKEE